MGSWRSRPPDPPTPRLARHAGTAGLLISCIVASCGGADRSAGRAADTPGLVVQRVSDLGTALPGQTLPGTLRISNPTEHTIRVSNVRKSCACTRIASSSFEIPPGGSYDLEIELTPGCPDRSSAFLKIITESGGEVTAWVEGACRYPFAESWEPAGHGARVALAPGVDPAVIERITCYWYPSDAPLAASIESSDSGAWLVVTGDPPSEASALDVVYLIAGGLEEVVQRIAPASHEPAPDTPLTPADADTKRLSGSSESPQEADSQSRA